MKSFSDIDFHLFVEGLIKTIELKDLYTAGHSRRVSEIAEMISREMNMSQEQCEYLHVTGHLHDIGKIGIPEGILMKAGRLSEAEYYLIQQHSVIGATIFKDIPGLSRMSSIIRHHHERYDGDGYPDRLIGDKIPIESAIISVADSFDAMTTFRPYKPALTVEMAIAEISGNSGRQFHPDVCNAFLRLYSDGGNDFLKNIGSIEPSTETGYLPFNSMKYSRAG